MNKENKRYVKDQGSILMIIAVVLILILVMAHQSYNVYKRNALYTRQIDKIQNEINEEEGRSRRIEDMRSYIDSDEYIEKTAREKFGLVYPDEVIFRSEG